LPKRASKTEDKVEVSDVPKSDARLEINAEGAAGALGWAWAAVKSKQPAAYQAQYGLF